ncbi:hypothetical protein P170DRAFT_478061 [Aspergillus steynii IBT 23096]|uniref:Uncharacterized protein n=1 Tax=Aspergillus steynii IBT 23096 TaxID=1392250 RepID=A0A2I2G2V6_9EURO|nr:uncharacterized protein P170DRAFT_478061 [Aspergillus steynii IBT 23096]PLB47201.1 hypothetical protein P170DRAFT_478061 [Aspergillus steynii IBT 23096]
MNFFLLMFLVFFTPVLLLLVWLALSSCLGSRFRSQFPRVPLRPGLDAYGRDYLRTMASSGPAMSEQIELENLVESDREE